MDRTTILIMTFILSMCASLHSFADTYSSPRNHRAHNSHLMYCKYKDVGGKGEMVKVKMCRGTNGILRIN